MDFSLGGAREVLTRTPDVLGALLDGISDEWLNAREDPGAWSPWQVCGHLLHIEQTDWLDRTRVILTHGPEHPFEPVDREAGFTRFADWSVSELVSAFAEERSRNLDELARLVDAAALSRTGRHPELGEVSLGQLLATWVVHDLNHLHQAVKTMAKHYGDAVGPWRDYLPVLDLP